MDDKMQSRYGIEESHLNGKHLLVSGIEVILNIYYSNESISNLYAPFTRLLPTIGQ